MTAGPAIERHREVVVGFAGRESPRRGVMASVVALKEEHTDDFIDLLANMPKD